MLSASSGYGYSKKIDYKHKKIYFCRADFYFYINYNDSSPRTVIF